VKIADFGIAKMLGAESGTGVPPVNMEHTGGTPVPHSLAAGTPQYMAPEQQTARSRWTAGPTSTRSCCALRNAHR